MCVRGQSQGLRTHRSKPDDLRNTARQQPRSPQHSIGNRNHQHLAHHDPPLQKCRWAQGRSSRKIQREFEHIRKRHCGQRFWDKRYFSTTAGNITDGVVMARLDRHVAKDGFSPSA